MKEIRTIKMIEQTEIKFVADDGKEFTGINAERECRIYEHSKNKEWVKRNFAHVEFEHVDIPILDFVLCDSAIYRAVLNSKLDFIAMMNYVDIIWGVSDNSIKEPESYPHTMFIHRDCEYATSYSGNLEEEFEKTLNQLRSHGGQRGETNE